MARSSALLAPRVLPPDLAPQLEPGILTRHAELRGVELADIRGTTDGSHAHIAESLLRNADVAALDLSGATLTDVEVDDLRAVELIARSSRWQSVRVTGGRIATLDLSRSDLTGVELRGLRIDYLTLAGSTVSDMLIADCTIGTLDAPQSTLRRVAFQGCRADEVDDRDWRIEHLDLRGLEALRFTDMASLRGATLSERQVTALAVDFAAAAGVDIRD